MKSFLNYLAGNSGRAKQSGRGSSQAAENFKVSKGAAKLTHDLGETVTSVVISEDNELFAAGATNKKAIVMNVSDGNVIAEFTAESGINASAIGGIGREARLIVGTFSGWIRVYHIASNREEHSLKFGDGDAVFCMSLTADSTRLAVGGKSSHILLYALSFSDEAVGMRILHRFKTHGLSTLSVSLDMTGEKLVAGGESKVVQMWVFPKPGGNAVVAKPGTGRSEDLSEQLLLPRVQFRTASTIHSLALNATGTTRAGRSSTVLPNDAFTSPPHHPPTRFHPTPFPPPLIHPTPSYPSQWQVTPWPSAPQSTRKYIG